MMLKIVLSGCLSALCGALFFYFFCFPVISHYFVGPVYGEDQMSLNFAIFIIGAPLFTLVGAVTGYLISKRSIKLI